MARKPPFPQMAADRLRQEFLEMAEYFPHWRLAVLKGLTDLPVNCGRCGELATQLDLQIVCSGCGLAIKPPKGAVLGWVGHLPVLVSGRRKAREKIARHPHPSYSLVHAEAAEFLLVPIIAAYPVNWPNQPPVIRYDSHLMEILEIPSWFGSTYHMLYDNVLCLYASNHWSAQTMRQVLQQRVVNHLASLIKCADGVAPAKAFIGRIHDNSWEPEQ